MSVLVHVISADDVFGPEKTVINECLFLRDSGWRAVIINIWPEANTELSRKVLAQGIEYQCLVSFGKFDWRAIRELKSSLLGLEATVVHSHGYKADLYTLLAARSAHVPVMTTVHGFTSENAKVRLYERVQTFLWRFFDLVVCVSDSYAARARSAGVPPGRIRVVRNAIVPGYVAAASARGETRGSLGIGDGDCVVGIVGRLGIEKGHALLLQVASRLCGEFPSLRLVVVGEGEQRQAIEDTVSRLGLADRVLLLGHRNDVPAVISALDVLAITSLREGLPNVLLEAMLQQVPAVAMAVGGIPEVISDGRNGLLVSPGDECAYGSALRRMLSEPDLRARLGTAARRTVTGSFLFGPRMAAMEGLYREISGTGLSR